MLPGIINEQPSTNLPMHKKAIIDDRLARLIGIPLLSLLIAHLLKSEYPDFGMALLISFVHTLITWEGCRFIFFYLRSKFPHYHQTLRRLLVQGVSMLLYNLLMAQLMQWVCLMVWSDLNVVLQIGGLSQQEILLRQLFNCMIPTAFVTLAYESAVFFRDWKSNVQKTEALARENMQSQLEALKNQLDPHFLFNSLNTLASLIDYENTGAQQYLERLSDVYRYVLLSRQKNTVTLKEEMDFLDAYVYLNKVRFRDNLQVVKEISPDAYQQQVAPLSLQMLVENAIKHNVVSRDRPLTIRIVQEGEGCLLVENNLQEKTIFEKSTKLGLRNISNRYLLLSEKAVVIDKDERVFKVRIPLLHSMPVPVALP